MKQCTGDCTPGETRLDDQRPGGRCRVCTCTNDGGWSCELTACECNEGDTIKAADGCNVCSCDPNAYDDTFHWGSCTEAGCGDRCPLPTYEVDCDANPVYAKNGSDGPCCRYECPSDAPPGWPQYPTLEACGGCPPGFVSCDGDPTNGCEVDPQTSVQHCGACNNVCATANGTSICVAGACAISVCNSGFADCDGDTSNGCETQLGSDPNNCGSCGSLCELPHASASCNAGACSLEACDVGFADCNGDAADGCEVNTAIDVNNCGLCGNVCSAGQGTPVCIDGTCPI